MDKFLLGLSKLRPGQLPASRDVMVSITPGEGRARLDPDQPPTLGTISQGSLVLESESFPRFAPLSLTLTGADLCFRVRNGKLLNFAFRHRKEDYLRLYLSGIWKAAYLCRLFQPLDDRVIITRVNTVAPDCDQNAIDRWNTPDISCRTMLHVNLLEGEIATSPDYSKLATTDLVEYGSLELRRNSAGVLKIQLHGARMVWDVANGNVVGFRLYDSRGPVVNVSLLDYSGAGVSASLAVVDTLP